MNDRDFIFAQPLEQLGKFEFDERTASVFEDMITRSVPGYRMTVAMSALVAKRFAQPESTCFDLGCSLGACTFAMASQIQVGDCQIVGVDNSKAMLQRCRERDTSEQIRWVHSDLQSLPVSNASVVVLNFTLQFIPLEERDALIKNIFKGLREGGALILSEKIEFENAATDQLLYELHHDFKRANGYRELEISQKRDAIEDVLIRESSDTHLNRLRRTGFSQVVPWLQCFNFVSYLAIKGAA